jgi:hypothetical protein
MTKYKYWLQEKKFSVETDVLITHPNFSVQWHIPVIYIDGFLGAAVLKSPGIISSAFNLERHKQRSFSV